MAKAPRHLPMLGIDSQKKKRGAINSSSTHIDQSGPLDAIVRLFHEVIDEWKARPFREISETDELDVYALARTCERRLSAHPDLADPTSDVRDLSEAYLRLKQLRGKKPSKLLREVDAIVTEVVSEPIARLKKALETAIGQAPHRVADIVFSVHGALQSIELPEPNSEPSIVLGRLIRALSELDQRRSGLPLKSLQFVLQRLAERAIPVWAQAIASLAEELVVEKLKFELEKLTAFLVEIQARGVTFTKNLESSQAHLEAWRAETATSAHVSKASVVLELPGPDELAVIAGMMTRLNCKDRSELCEVLRAKWESAIRTRTLGWLSPDSPFGILLMYGERPEECRPPAAPRPLATFAARPRPYQGDDLGVFKTQGTGNRKPSAALDQGGDGAAGIARSHPIYSPVTGWLVDLLKAQICANLELRLIATRVVVPSVIRQVWRMTERIVVRERFSILGKRGAL